MVGVLLCPFLHPCPSLALSENYVYWHRAPHKEVVVNPVGKAVSKPSHNKNLGERKLLGGKRR
jgi:hypothetical protein